MLIFFLLALYFFLFRRTKRLARYLQQEDYDARRFLAWVFRARAFDTKGSIISCLAIVLGLPAAVLGFLAAACFEKNPERYGKKPFVKTERAKRLLWTAFGLELLTGIPLILKINSALAALFLCQAVPLFLAIAVAVLSFDEKRRQKKYFKKAHRRLIEVNPQVIGITGSYGKTSTKHFLGKLLNITLGPAFYPGKGVNTPMGITREIQRSLRDKTPYAVIEMAAYNQGSISRLCRLSPPHGAIITCIGLAHLERFKTHEMIRKTKSELAAAVPHDGFLVLNGDDPHCRLIGKDHPKKTLIYYGYNEGDLQLSCGPADLLGTQVTLQWQGKFYACKVPVFGKPLIANLGAAFATACHLGADPSYAASALPHLGTVDNRLQMRMDGEVTYLHDAYNSNPSGFESALEVLKAMPGKRRILITPGMIELGPLQYAENERLAEMAGQIVDIALIVGSLNLASLKSGLSKGGALLHLFKTRDEAFGFLKNITLTGDIILIENDLPDLYEMREVF